MNRLLQDGLTAPLRYKLLGLMVALVLGFGLTVTGFLLRIFNELSFLAASVFGVLMGIIGLLVAGVLVRRKRTG